MDLERGPPSKKTVIKSGIISLIAVQKHQLLIYKAIYRGHVTPIIISRCPSCGASGVCSR